MHYKNVSLYIEDDTDDKSLKLNGPFHIIEVIFQKKTYKISILLTIV